MSAAARRLITGHIAMLVAGAVIGWIYSQLAAGLLVTAIVLLIWHVRRVVNLDRATRDRNFENSLTGDGIWSQLHSRFSYQLQRSDRHKKNFQALIREVQKSTNAMPDGGVILNQNFEIVFCNKAAKRLGGFRRRRDRGQRVENILRDPLFGQYLQSGDFELAVEIRSPVCDDGWLLCRLVPYGVNQRLLLLQDITERRRLAAMRRDFVANASHELRSPLTVVSGYLDTLVDDDELPPAWKRPIQQMQAQTLRMNNIVSELMELSRLEGSGSAPQDEVVDVCDLLVAAKKSLADQPGSPTIKVECQTKLQLRGSAQEVESVIVNLVSNAIRHTPPDGQIELSWRENDDNSESDRGATLSVDDTGIGIDAENIPRLTERFFRIDPGRSRDDGGIGLGLAIVKHVLERHDAVLDIQSEPGKGSTFQCHFPGARLLKPDSFVTKLQ